MDKLSKLQALTGKQNVVASQASDANDGWVHHVRASHIYEGSDDDSDDDKEWHTKPVPQQQVSKKIAREGEEPHYQFPESSNQAGGTHESGNMGSEFQGYKAGQLANGSEEFCALGAMKKYPYTYIGADNQQRVAEKFFDKNQLLDKNSWDLFYVHTKRPGTGYSDVIILVPTTQFVKFLNKINKELGTKLCIPPGASFDVTFGIQGMPHPRYLGRSTSADMSERLKLNIPPNNYTRPGEPESVKPTDRSLEAFRKKIELLQLAQKVQKKVKAEKKKTERLAERQAWSHSLKRAQRYLGLRETRVGPTPKKYQLTSDWSMPTIVNQLPPTKFEPDKLAPFLFEGDVVFISVDVEAYEKDHNKITEIGISTLDTRDLADLVPGEGGINWINPEKVIRARHFRISDYKHLNNSEFIDGCADRFEFGTSEFISLRQAQSVVASCFKYPFSQTNAPAEENENKRNIILVGHDVMQDVNYLRKAGYDVYNLSNLMEQVDTASMWRYLTRDPNPRNLGAILADLGITGWNLHNAGNDAAYTLQAMVGIAVKAIVDKTKGREFLEAEKLKRVSAATAEAKATAIEREGEWGSDGDSDGGKPVKPAPTVKLESVASQSTFQAMRQVKKPIDKDNGPWGSGPWEHKQVAAGTNSWAQDDSAEKGGWRKPQGSQNNSDWNSGGWGASITKKSSYVPPSGHQFTKSPGVYDGNSYTRGGSRYVPAYDGSNKQPQGNGDWGNFVPSQVTQNYDKAPAISADQTWGAQVGESSYGNVPPHLRPAINTQVKQEVKQEIKQEQEPEDDGWGITIPRKYTARPATPPIKQEQIKQEHNEDNDFHFQDEIPAGYSPGRRNNPIQEAIRTNSSSGTNHRAGAPPNQQPLPHLAGTGNTAAAASGYRPTSRNPAKHDTRDYGQLNQYSVTGGANEQAGVEEGFDELALSDDGKATGGHVDAW